MMADLLEEAIAEAEELQKAAEKSAKAEILEKHHEEIKDKEEEILEEKKSNLLNEQPEEEGEEEIEGLDDEELDLGDEEFGFDQDESGLDDQVPDAAAEGENLCPGEGEEVKIDFDELEQKIDNMDQESTESHEEAAQDVAADEDEMLEEFEVDMEPTKSGNTGRPDKEMDREEEKEFPDEDEDNPHQPDSVDVEDKSNVVKLDEHKQKVSELHSKIQALEKQVESLKEGHDELKQERDDLRDKLLEQNKKLQESNRDRAQLYYQNQVLESSSLNERQKRKLASALNDAGSAKEAKLIYENVTKAVESETGGPAKEEPQTLNEAADVASPSHLKVPSAEEKKREKRAEVITESEKDDLLKRAGLTEDK